jgi:hypothetical protein
MGLSEMAKEMEALACRGRVDDMDARIRRLAEEYMKVEIVLGALRAAPSEFKNRGA